MADLYAQHDSGLEEALPLMRQATELEPASAGHWVQLGKAAGPLEPAGTAREAGERA